MSTTEPELIFTESGLCQVIKQYADDDTQIFLDEFNAEVFRSCKNFYKFKPIVVDCCEEARVEIVKVSAKYKNVIAIGGCTALDFGRACAHADGSLTLIPSILSTSCISVNRSIIYLNGNHRSVVTPIPNSVVISYPLLQESHECNKWSHSGFGDLFANISAVIDYLNKGGSLESKTSQNIINMVGHYIPECISALNWVVEEFKEFDKLTLMKLGHYLYNSGIDVIKKGDTEFSAGGEHRLFYVMMKQQAYSRRNPTHGELVSIGTLLSAGAVKDDSLFVKLRVAFEKLGLPVTYSDLKVINVDKSHILEGLEAIRGCQSFLGKCGMAGTRALQVLLDKCYG